MKKYLLLLLSALVLVSCDSDDDTNGGGDGNPITKAGITCETITEDFMPEWKYCIHRYEDSNDDVLMYFHGQGGSELTWQNGQLEKDILATWRTQGIKVPVVVSISFGETWFLAEANSSPYSGMYEIYLKRILPIINLRLSKSLTRKNYLLGVSMGGFNAAQLYIKQPQMFDRVALLCPVMALISPQASDLEVQQYISETGADPIKVAQSLELGKYFFPTVVDWNKHSPNVLLPQLSGNDTPAYIANGLSDDYGFAFANEKFATDAQLMGVPISSDFYPGQEHCGVDASRAALALIPQ